MVLPEQRERGSADVTFDREKTFFFVVILHIQCKDMGHGSAIGPVFQAGVATYPNVSSPHS